MKAAVKALDNKKAGDIDLDDAVFGVAYNEGLLQETVRYQLAKRQSGTHKVKTRSEVKATGKKPFRQKGTGRARAGSLVRPIDVGGGVAHGPKVRSHAIEMPKKKRSLALKVALSAKLKEGKLIVLDSAKVDSHKTKPVALALKKMGLEGSALIVDGEDLDSNFSKATANIPKIDLLPTRGANVYDILRRDVLILTRSAVSELTEKLKG